MTTLRPGLIYAVVPMLALAAANAAAAAPPEATTAHSAEQSQTTGNMTEVVVTAQRRRQLLSDVGMTVNSVDGDFLAERQINSAGDLPQIVSALSVTENADGTPVYTLRGVGFNSTNLGAQPTVSVYYDEAPLPYGPMTQGPLFDLERVEVLKGPQGTLYGQNSTGGAINYIAAKPTDQFLTGANVSAGRFSTFQGEGFVSGPLGEKLAARLALDGTFSDDWQTSYRRNDTIGKQRKFAARMLFAWKPSDTVQGSFNLNGWLDKSDNQIPQFLTAVPRVPAHALPALLTLPAAPEDTRAADWDPGSDFARDNWQWQAVARFDVAIGSDYKLTSLSNYARVTVKSRYDNDGTAFNLADVTTNGRVEVFTQEFRFAHDIGAGRGNFLLGANYQTDRVNEGSFQRFHQLSSTVDISSPPLPAPGLGTITQSENRGKQSNDATGVFGNIEWNLSERFVALAGARYTQAKHNNQSCTADTGNGDWAHVANGLIGLFTGVTGTLQPGDCVTLGAGFTAPFEKQSFKESNVSWRAGLNFKPRKDSLVYGLVSRGFKAGNYPIINAIARSSLRPVTQEELTAFELGLKTGVSSILRFDTAVYYYDYKDKQLLTNTVDPVFGLVPVLGNVPKSHAYGADIDATLTPLHGLTMRAAVGYQKTRIGSFGDYDVFGAPVSLSGHSFNFAPDLSVSADTEYRFNITNGRKAFIGGNLTHNSETFADLAESPALRIKPYTLLGLRAGIAGADDRWEAMIWGRNLTNEAYWTNAALGYDGLFRLTGRPRIYGVSVAYRPTK